MWLCAVCSRSFLAYYEWRAHCRHCDSNVSQETINIPSIPLGLELDAGSQEEMNETDFQSIPLDLETGVLLDLSSLEDVLHVPSSPHGTVGTWRHAAETLSQKAPQISIFSSHETRVERDVRRNEQRLAAMWTNNNFRVLSQLVNSLSLSQSDTDRVLNAVLYFCLSSFHCYSAATPGLKYGHAVDFSPAEGR